MQKRGGQKRGRVDKRMIVVYEWEVGTTRAEVQNELTLYEANIKGLVNKIPETFDSDDE